MSFKIPTTNPLRSESIIEHRNPSEKEKQIEKIKKIWINCTKEDASLALMNDPPGTLLIRPTQSKPSVIKNEPYEFICTLSFRVVQTSFENLTGVYNIRVLIFEDGKLCPEIDEVENERYDEIEDVLEYLRSINKLSQNYFKYSLNDIPAKINSFKDISSIVKSVNYYKLEV
ncbi:MAG: hypothetical protein JHC93_07600 [Parachlamydiales bacterium]|nr:hypothetical protein [Parachlamydiales bacterium]